VGRQERQPEALVNDEDKMPSRRWPTPKRDDVVAESLWRTQGT